MAKFRIGQRIKIDDGRMKNPIFGTIREVVESDTVAYGIVCEGFGHEVFYFNERVVFAPGE